MNNNTCHNQIKLISIRFNIAIIICLDYNNYNASINLFVNEYDVVKKPILFKVLYLKNNQRFYK